MAVQGAEDVETLELSVMAVRRDELGGLVHVTLLGESEKHGPVSFTAEMRGGDYNPDWFSGERLITAEVNVKGSVPIILALYSGKERVYSEP
jgi:hypothetical protein